MGNTTVPLCSIIYALYAPILSNMCSLTVGSLRTRDPEKVWISSLIYTHLILALSTTCETQVKFVKLAPSPWINCNTYRRWNLKILTLMMFKKNANHLPNANFCTVITVKIIKKDMNKSLLSTLWKELYSVFKNSQSFNETWITVKKVIINDNPAKRKGM